MRLRIKYFTRKHKDKLYKYPCLGYSYRDHKGMPQFNVVLNLSRLPEEAFDAVSSAISGEDVSENGTVMVSMEKISFQGSMNIGDAWVALRIAEDLGICRELDRLPQEHRTLTLAMIIDRVINPKPYSKLELHESFKQSPLARIVDYRQKQPLHEWYYALESLYQHQDAIEKSLFSRMQKPQKMFLYDITSTYFEGNCCPLAAFGYNRDGKKGKKQIVVGLLTSSDGRPISVQVFPGNTSDQTTTIGQIQKLKNHFAIDEIIFIGDRGMITSTRRNDLSEEEFTAVKYISALSRDEIMKLMEDPTHPLQLTLFDRQNLAEVEMDGTRYVLCFNPDRREQDRITRNQLLEKTQQKLAKLQHNVQTGRYKKGKVIAKHLYNWLNRWNMGKFFDVFYIDGYFSFIRKEDKIVQSENLDGYYVLITSVPRSEMEKEEVRSRYKSLSLVEQAFRSMKTSNLLVRPIRHWNPDRVRGHIFICMLSYLIVWQTRLLFQKNLKRDDKNHYCEAGNLRKIWDELNKITVGTISVSRRSFQQIPPLSRYQQSLLTSANATFDKHAKERLHVVG